MSKKCPFCGAILDDDDLFCDECGERQKGEEIIAETESDVDTAPDVGQKQDQDIAKREKDDKSCVSFAKIRNEVLERKASFAKRCITLKENYGKASVCLNCGKKHLLFVSKCKQCGANDITGKDNRYYFEYRKAVLADFSTCIFVYGPERIEYLQLRLNGKVRHCTKMDSAGKYVEETVDSKGRYVGTSFVVESDDTFFMIPPEEDGMIKEMKSDGLMYFFPQKTMGTIKSVYTDSTFGNIYRTKKASNFFESDRYSIIPVIKAYEGGK